MIRVRLLEAGDEGVLDHVAEDVFDGPLRPELVEEFIADPRHHLAVALDAGVVVGIASAVHYIHPDKEPELWINEVGVAASHRRRGIARRLLKALGDVGRTLGCREAWVLTERPNHAANALYSSIGGREEDGEVVLYSWSLNRNVGAEE